ncbi:hypothetical protein [Staphylococcus xylosus]
MNLGNYHIESFWVTMIIALLLFSFMMPIFLLFALGIFVYGIERRK